MALVVFDRVQQTGSANTTVSFTLTGTVTGFQSFAVVGNGNTTFYSATDASGNWEVGVGTYSSTGPTLTRTTIISSSNSGSAVTFSGTVTVFVTYPAEKSVNLDASGNVTALGTITSGVWNGTTIPVAYGGTGVTVSSGANSVVLRDSNQNITANNILSGYNVITAAGTTTVLTVASAYYQRISGSTTQTIQLPDATTLVNGQGFTFDNDSSGTVTIVDSASATVDTVPSGAYSYIFVESNATSAGSWGKYALIPASYDFSTTTANFGNATIINTTYQGNAITSAYGGTGLTSFGAANYALYSTSSSLLTAGTLPTAAGGTNSTATPTAGGAVYGTGSAYAITAVGTTGQVLTSNGASAPTWTTPTTGTVTSVTGTAPVVSSGGTTPAISMAAANTTTNGYLTSTDWNTFNGKGSGTVTSVTATSPVTSTGGTTPVIAMPAATGSVNGYLTSTDWTTFNNKGSGSVTSVAASVPSVFSISGSPITTSGTLAITYSGTALPIANGGTNSTATPTAGGAGYGTGTAHAYTAAGTTGQVLTSNGSGAPTWSTPSAAATPITQNLTTVSTNQIIGSGSNGFSVGPITIASGYSVTVASGQRWVVI
jgi:hypothetical protein